MFRNIPTCRPTHPEKIPNNKSPNAEQPVQGASARSRGVALEEVWVFKKRCFLESVIMVSNKVVVEFVVYHAAVISVPERFRHSMKLLVSCNLHMGMVHSAQN